MCSRQWLATQTRLLPILSLSIFTADMRCCRLNEAGKCPDSSYVILKRLRLPELHVRLYTRPSNKCDKHGTRFPFLSRHGKIGFNPPSKAGSLEIWGGFQRLVNELLKAGGDRGFGGRRNIRWKEGGEEFGDGALRRIQDEGWRRRFYGGMLDEPASRFKDRFEALPYLGAESTQKIVYRRISLGGGDRQRSRDTVLTGAWTSCGGPQRCPNP